MSECESFQEAKKRIRQQNESQIHSSVGKKVMGKEGKLNLKKNNFQNAELLTLFINV